MFVIEFLAWIAPGSGLLYVIFRFTKAKSQLAVTRYDATMSEKRREDQALRAQVAEDTARDALTGMTQAIETTRVIELVDEKITGLTRYLVDRIEGTVAQRATGRHALPAEVALPRLGSGIPQEQEHKEWS